MSKFNPTERVKKVMQYAQEESARLGHSYVGTEHLLLGLIREGKGKGATVLMNLGLNLEAVKQQILDYVSSSGNVIPAGQQVPFTPRAKHILEVAHNEATEMKTPYVGTEHLLLALVRDKEGVAAQILAGFGIDDKVVREEVTALITGKPSQRGEKRKSRTPFLDHFGRDLTQLAREGKLDPIIGRDREIERVSQILARRKKNNPVLIGEPGVGKTAIAEGLAQRIVARRVPQVLMDKRLVTLDLGGIVAGTKYRGQFEERIKTIMNELLQNRDVVIFIDELHTIVGAGSAEGTLDASNMFKPALSRGELQCIGATTLNEYRKYIEKDGALERRFQTIMVDPPSVDDTIKILMGLKTSYEAHHKVGYTDRAIESAVRMADRYISDRFLPDKAIDVLDETGSRVHLAKLTPPQDIKDLDEKIAEVAREKNSLVEQQRYEEAARLRDTERRLREELDEKKRRWERMVQDEVVEVNEDDIAVVISSMTGIPVMRLAKTESERLLGMEEEVKRGVVGQDEAVMAVSRAIRRTRAGLKDPQRPVGSFIFLGPTGVGKTHLARKLAQYLFENEEAMIRVDMSEYMEKFSVSRLVGAPPGYIGYDEGGQLTEKVRRRPYCVVLLDEIEKAHPDVFNILLQVFDEGHLTDSFGRKVSFKDAILIMTSNLGTRDISKGGGGLGFQKVTDRSVYEQVEEKIREELKKTFNPEFLNRIDEVVIFRSLGKKEIIQIIDIMLDEVLRRVAERNITVTMTQGAKQFIAEKGYDPTFGARHLKRTIQRFVEDPMAEEILRGRFGPGSEVRISKRGDGLVFSEGKEIHRDETEQEEVVAHVE
ncbi:MAG: ATP-dependent Clp protease ATP-binding subunit [Candidatus Latescibacteria bacterium]|nr:ATP-dependent Clp protease ATP-binding subunit [Candidatus Latescibacterota bacterium]